MNSQFVHKTDLAYLNQEIFAEGKLSIKPKAFYDSIPINDINYFMWENGIYCLPTQELIEFFQEQMVGTTIEIGAGNGAIGRALNIPITDSKLQEGELIRLYYKSLGQPIINYPEDIEKLDAMQAINKYKPQTVIGSFITHKYNGISGNEFGVKEEYILDRKIKYILVGNEYTHKHKPILGKKHLTFSPNWLITRSNNQQLNRIWIWNN